MPYASEKQRKFFNANRKQLEAQGVDVDEWNASTKGKDLPKKAPMKKSAAAVLYNVLLRNRKHAMDALGLKAPTPKTSNQVRRPRPALNPPAPAPAPAGKAGSVLMPSGK